MGRTLGVNLALADRKGKGRKQRGKTSSEVMCLSCHLQPSCSHTKEVPWANRSEGIAQHLSQTAPKNCSEQVLDGHI